MVRVLKTLQLVVQNPSVLRFDGDWNDKKIIDLLAGPDSPLRPTNDHPLELVLGKNVLTFDW